MNASPDKEWKDKIKAIRHAKDMRRREAAKLEEESAKLNAAKGHGRTTPPPHDSPNPTSTGHPMSDFAKLKKRAVKAKKTREREAEEAKEERRLRIEEMKRKVRQVIYQMPTILNLIQVLR